MFKNYKIYSALFICNTIFGGCTPMIVTSDPGSVVIDNASAFNAGRAQKMAELVCRRHGKKAIYRPDTVRDGQATYECIK